MPILRALGVAFATECSMVDKILDALRANHPIKAIGMGEPPGTHGIAHVLKGAYLKESYIKLKIDEDIVYVLSFHL